MKKIKNELILISGYIRGIKSNSNINNSFENKIILNNKFINEIKKEENIKYKNINNLRFNVLIIIIIIISNLFLQVLPANKSYLIASNLNKIKLKIKGTGHKYILCPDFENEYYPNMIYINGNLSKIVTYSYFFDQIENYVELIWDYKIDHCKYIFHKCSDITEIDLNEFDSSDIINMDYMFTDCISLTKINFTNFVTFNAIEMYDMFRNCSSLTSLDLSNFDTSKVKSMVALFKDCSSLTSLVLSNFDT